MRKLLSIYICTSSYKEPENIADWSQCPNCQLKPKVCAFDNGRSTACGCGNSDYDHFSIHAESIMSVHINNNGNTSSYNFNELCENWNHWVKTGEILFKKPRNDGRW
jgi:hypothetical protein